MNTVPLTNTKYRKDQLEGLKDRNFSTFTPPVENLEVDRTVDQFFEDYERIFFKIPVEGVSKSHRYLVEKSSSLLNLEQSTLDIQPLLDEIAQLREELLAAKTENLTATQDQLKVKEIVDRFNLGPDYTG